MSKPELSVDDRRLPGIRVYQAEDKVVFIEDRFGRFMSACPHCEGVYWRRIGDKWRDDVSEECRRAIIDHQYGIGEYDRMKQPFAAKEAVT